MNITPREKKPRRHHFSPIDDDERERLKMQRGGKRMNEVERVEDLVPVFNLILYLILSILVIKNIIFFDFRLAWDRF